MATDKERKRIVLYIKNYYNEFGKTPSMKDISLKCDVNPRVFYQLFGSQEEAFNLAGIPYSDEARKKVEKANIVRKFGKDLRIERRPVKLFKIIPRHDARNQYPTKYYNKVIFMTKRLSNSYWNLRRANPDDKDFIKIAYEEMLFFIIKWYYFLEYKEQEYENIRYSTDPMKFAFMAGLGYDFNDLEGSYKEICKEEFLRQKRFSESRMWDAKKKEYFRQMLDEAFGSPPDLG